MIVAGGRILYPSLRYTLLVVGSLFLVGCNGLPLVPEKGEVSEVSAVDTEQAAVQEVQTPEIVIEEQSITAESVVAEKVAEPVVQPSQEASSTAVVANATLSGRVQLTSASASQNGVAAPMAPRQDMTPSNRIELWLAQAELAMDKDQLTTPAGNNAYAYYARVLMQDENNALALQGLERIVQRYLTLAKSAHRKGKTQQAQLFLSRANKVVPRHSQIAVVKQQIAQPYVVSSKADNKTKKQKKAKKPLQLTKYRPLQTQAESLLDAPEGMQRQRILLPKSALKKEASALAIYLRSLARQIEEVDGRLYIIAPKDKQVRWVYGLLNGTNPDYRIRANIKHKSPAAIEVMYKADTPLLDVFH